VRVPGRNVVDAAHDFLPATPLDPHYVEWLATKIGPDSAKAAQLLRRASAIGRLCRRSARFVLPLSAFALGARRRCSELHLDPESPAADTRGSFHAVRRPSCSTFL
jgi:hypothetical protein